MAVIGCTIAIVGSRAHAISNFHPTLQESVTRRYRYAVSVLQVNALTRGRTAYPRAYPAHKPIINIDMLEVSSHAQHSPNPPRSCWDLQAQAEGHGPRSGKCREGIGFYTSDVA